MLIARLVSTLQSLCPFARRLLVAGTFVPWLAMVSPPASALPFTGLYVIGDSLSDQGNLFAATSVLGPPLGQVAVPEAAHYFQGRFSNGENYVDVLARRLGVSSTPSLSGGNNFAFGGTRTDYNRVEVAPGIGVYPRGAYPWTLNLQREAFTARAASTAIDPNALFVVFSGSNDLADILSRRLDPATVIPGVIAAVGNVIEAYKAAGAQTVLVPNLPNLGVVPAITSLEPRAPGISAMATALSRAYNAALANLLDGETGIRVVRFDTYSFVTDVVAHPTSYGLLNATNPCYTGYVEPAPGTTVCANPESYAFWDVEHPTVALHTLLANQMFLAVSAVPSPPTSALFGLGVLALFAMHRRRSAARGGAPAVRR